MYFILYLMYLFYKKCPYFIHGLDLQMIRIGSRSGQLETVMKELEADYDERSSDALDSLIARLEPVLFGQGYDERRHGNCRTHERKVEVSVLADFTGLRLVFVGCIIFIFRNNGFGMAC